MHITVVHRTVYRYSAPVFLEPHVVRLRPRTDAAQRLIQHQLSIAPEPLGQAVFLDQDGNIAAQVWFEGLAAELSLQTAFSVETLRENPFDFLLPSPGVLAMPPSYSERERDALQPYLATADSVGEYARDIAGRASGQTMPFLEALTRDLFENSAHVVRPEGAPHTPAETLLNRSGSCRDLAVLFCAACRAAGVPARFVSGYECSSHAASDVHMHAWAEVYVPGGGWRGYDPSRGIAVSTSHVTVAAAADPAMAAPVIGSFRGPATAAMEFAISIQAS